MFCARHATFNIKALAIPAAVLPLPYPAISAGKGSVQVAKARCAGVGFPFKPGEAIRPLASSGLTLTTVPSDNVMAYDI
jgi:hypothetical protein